MLIIIIIWIMSWDYMNLWLMKLLIDNWNVNFVAIEYWILVVLKSELKTLLTISGWVEYSWHAIGLEEFRDISTSSRWDTGCHYISSDRFDEVPGTNFTSARPMRHWVSTITSNYPMRHWVPYWCVWLDPCIRQSPSFC